MSRIKLQLPESFVFETTIKVPIGDINYGGHLSNDAYLRLAHEARIQFLETKGWSEVGGFGAESCGLIMTDAAIQFKSEVFRAHVLKIEIAVDDVSSMGFDLYYKISFNENDKLVGVIKTGMCFFDYGKKVITKAPYSTVDKLLSLCIH